MEQSITTAIGQAKTSLQEQPALSKNCEQKVLSLRENYQSFEHFALVYNPDSQIDFGSDVRATIMNDYSTLEMLDMAYGDGSAAAWLVTSLADLNKFSGSKNMDDGQTKWLAKLMFQEYKDVKFSVIQLFFYKFKCGYFGKFYGKVDPMVITCALKAFMVEVETKRQEFLNEDYEKKRQQEDAEKEVRLHVECLWYRCQASLVKYCLEHNFEDVFSRLSYKFYNVKKKNIIFEVSHADYELVEGMFLHPFSEALKKFLPGVMVQYKVLDLPEDKNEYKSNLLEERERMKAQREIASGIESAKKILSNTLGLDKEAIAIMKDRFRKRFGLSPEDYIKKHQHHG